MTTKQTKQQLIELAEAQNIKFKKSWTKAKIQEAIELGITNDTPTIKTCKLSGLKFNPAEFGKSDRTEVHPEIAAIKMGALKHNWYGGCMAALEYGKQNNLQSLEDFDVLFERAKKDKALDGSEDNLAYNVEIFSTGKAARFPMTAWAALVTGTNTQYTWERTFLKPVETDYRTCRFNLTEPGLYQCRSLNYKGTNSTDFWYEIKEPSGELVEVTKNRAFELFGKPEIFTFLNPQIHFVKNGLIRLVNDPKCWQVLECKEEYFDEELTGNVTYYCKLATQKQTETFDREIAEAIAIETKIEAYAKEFPEACEQLGS